MLLVLSLGSILTRPGGFLFKGNVVESRSGDYVGVGVAGNTESCFVVEQSGFTVGLESIGNGFAIEGAAGVAEGGLEGVGVGARFVGSFLTVKENRSLDSEGCFDLFVLDLVEAGLGLVADTLVVGLCRPEPLLLRERVQLLAGTVVAGVCADLLTVRHRH